MNKKNVAVVGASGKMGSLVCEKLSTDYHIIKITEENPLSYNAFNEKINLVIDFANASSSLISARYCEKYKIPLLVASTGQTEDELNEIKSYSSKIPIMICHNLSIGIMIVKKIINSMINYFDYDITIYEKHHKEKKDKPSGTALMLNDFIKSKIKDKNINILSERGGKEIGTHSINFYFKNEFISISHQAFSREAFADGAKLAVNYLIKQSEPKLYSFDDLLIYN